MNVSFASVYRVSTRSCLAAQAEVDALAREIGMELPIGYREFITSFGSGELCDAVIVYMPGEIRDVSNWRNQCDRDRLLWLAQNFRSKKIESIVTPEDLEEAIVFAIAAAESPIYVASRRLGPRLFEQVEDWIVEIPEGFYGLVEPRTSRMPHDFPFFEPHNGRRRMRIFALRADIGRDGFVDALARRWGRETLRRSGPVPGTIDPHFFVQAIEGCFELLDEPHDTRLPPDCFFVRARYDTDSEMDVATFVELVSLPGGTRWDYIGMA